MTGLDDEKDLGRTDRGENILSLYRKLWHLLKPGAALHVHALIAAYAMACGRIAASLAGPYFLAAVLDKALPSRNMALFTWHTAAILASLAALFIFSFLNTYFLGKALERIFLDLRNRLISSALKKPSAFFAKYELGDLITRISGDTESLSMVAFDYTFPSLYQIALAIVFVVLMLAWKWQLGLYTTLSLPCYLYLMSLLQKPLSQAAQTARERLSEQNDTTLDILSGVKEIRFYQQSKEGIRRFSHAASLFTAAHLRSTLIGEWTYNSMELFSGLVGFLPFLLGGYWICRGDSSITVGVLVAYNLFLAHISQTLQTTVFGITRLFQASPLIGRIREALEYPEEEILPIFDKTDMMRSTQIEYRNVWFSHAPGKPVLKDFSLTIEPGEKVAIMGPSGAGKSTLIDMLTRNIEPSRGEILFGGKPIGEYHLPFYLQHYSYVRQTPYIFKTTVRENIAAGWYHVPLDVIVDAAKRVRIHDAVMHLSEGYDTIIGAGGIDLSGGQRQRLALARALVRDPAILLLDEFTSALDGATEEAILDDLFTSFQKQTIICVTHSQSVANRFARVVRIEKL